MSRFEIKDQRSPEMREATDKLLNQLRDFERELGMEQRSLIYSYMAANGITDPGQIELVREQLPDEPERVRLRFYVQPKDRSRDLLVIENKYLKADKLLRRTLPKLVAHKRTLAARAKVAAMDGDNDSQQSWNEASDYVGELVSDIQDLLGIVTFTSAEN